MYLDVITISTPLTVWPDWAIFESAWLQILQQKYPKYFLGHHKKASVSK